MAMIGGTAYLVKSEKTNSGQNDWTTDLYIYVKIVSQNAAANTSTIALGMDDFDGEAFTEQIDHIMALEDGSLESRRSSVTWLRWMKMCRSSRTTSGSTCSTM